MLLQTETFAVPSSQDLFSENDRQHFNFNKFNYNVTKE
jgi:hypothetical protein